MIIDITRLKLNSTNFGIDISLYINICGKDDYRKTIKRKCNSEKVVLPTQIQLMISQFT